MGARTKTGLSRLNRRDFLRRSTSAALAMAVPGVSVAVRGNQLHIRTYADVQTLDPPYLISGAEGIVINAIFQGLLKFKQDGSWDTEPDAAEYFEQIDDTHYAFRLKPGQLFSNGYGEMTADDVKFSFERIIDPDLNAINAIEMGTLSHVEVHDRYSGTIVLKSTLASQGELNLAPVVINEITVVGSRCGLFKEGIAMLQQHRDMPVERLITAKYPLAQSLEAFNRAQTPGALKVLIEVAKPPV